MSTAILTGGWFQDVDLPDYVQVMTDGWWDTSVPPAPPGPPESYSDLKAKRRISMGQRRHMYIRGRRI